MASKEVNLVCVADRVLPVRKGKYGNEEDLTLEFIANVPTKVLDSIATAYVQTFPDQYRIVNDKEAEELFEEHKKFLREQLSITKDSQVEVEEFDVVKFFNTRTVDRDALEELADLGKLWKIAKHLAIRNVPQNTGAPKLIERILLTINELAKSAEDKKDENAE